MATARSGSKVTTSGPETAELHGRPLNADALISTGVVDMLLNRADLDLQAVAEDLADYLAGPPIDIWDYAIVDSNLTLSDPPPGC